MTMHERHEDSGILAQIVTYYESKLELYGKTPRGVDWNGSEGQELRFRQLCRLIPSEGRYSVFDYGCGYGALYKHLMAHNEAIHYLGFDISELMIEAAKQELSSGCDAEFYTHLPTNIHADYALASGLFNVKQEVSDTVWIDYCIGIMDQLNNLSVRGFGFNCLTSYADEPLKRKDLFYADPAHFFNLCMQRYSRKVSLTHDYPLFEFTILVGKEQ